MIFVYTTSSLHGRKIPTTNYQLPGGFSRSVGVEAAPLMLVKFLRFFKARQQLSCYNVLYIKKNLRNGIEKEKYNTLYIIHTTVADFPLDTRNIAI